MGMCGIREKTSYHKFAQIANHHIGINRERRRVLMAIHDYSIREIQFYSIDLKNVNKHGDFQCPKCGKKIDPDDESGNVYTLSNTKLTDRGDIKSMNIFCYCGASIELTGFQPIKEEK